jgi:hypothetical protein
MTLHLSTLEDLDGLKPSGQEVTQRPGPPSTAAARSVSKHSPLQSDGPVQTIESMRGLQPTLALVVCTLACPALAEVCDTFDERSAFDRLVLQLVTACTPVEDPEAVGAVAASSRGALKPSTWDRSGPCRVASASRPTRRFV